MLNKRIFGWCKWTFERSKIHLPKVVDALVADLRETQPDHVAITGDLTNLGLEEEFAAAGVWLRQLGDRRFVSLVPGNHDAYVPTPWNAAWGHWQDYLDSDTTDEALLAPAASFQELTDTYFPSVRIRGPLALVGVCTAQPVGLFLAGGTVGARQLERLERILRELAGSDLCRIVLIHHPPMHDDWTLRRGLADSTALCQVFRQTGADLILHGHAHKTMIGRMPGPHGAIPVIGVRSASHIGHRPNSHRLSGHRPSGHRPGRVAQYHLYQIERRNGRNAPERFRITMVMREYDAASGSFHFAEERTLLP
jgi:3',5'-cyclic AMP phosphodiesterase CpdA